MAGLHRNAPTFFVVVVAGERADEAPRLLMELEQAKTSGINLVFYGRAPADVQKLLTRNGWHLGRGGLDEALQHAQTQHHDYFVFLQGHHVISRDFFQQAAKVGRPQRVRLSRDGAFICGKAGLTSHVETDIVNLVSIRQAPPSPPKPVAAPAPPPPAPSSPVVAQTPKGPTRLASFLVATHHRPQLLQGALASILNQAVPVGWDFEILVAGRPGDLGRTVAEVAGARYVPVEHDWVTAKLNALVNEAQGELCLAADDDDLQDPARLTLAVRAHLDGADFTASGTTLVLNLNEGQLSEWSGPAAYVGTTVSVRTSKLKEVGGWPMMQKGKDKPMAERLRAAGATFVEIPLHQTVVRQHGTNLWGRPVVEKGQTGTKGSFRITGLGSLQENVGRIPPSMQSILAIPEPELQLDGGGPALTFAKAGPGQSAFIDGLLDLGFKTATRAEVEKALAAGQPVLFHGWWDEYEGYAKNYPNQFFTLWHSGFAGSDLMGEGETLSKVLRHVAEGRGRVLWLERRDVLVKGALHMAPVWSPQRMALLAEPKPPKLENSVLVGFHGKYPSNAKNILASVAGAAMTTGNLHLSNSVFEGNRGRAIRAILAGRDWASYNPLPRAEAVRLAASMTVMSHVSLSDTWPYLVMEAVYAGTPVVLCDVVNWTRHLSDWAKERCVVRPATSSEAIREKIQHLLDSPEDRERLVREQQETLDRLAPIMAQEAATILGGLGFPVRRPKGARMSLPVLNNPPPAAAPPTPAPPPTPEPPPAPSSMVGGKLDLRDQVTVFVIASGEPSVNDCHAHLDRQDSLFRRENIYFVAPMWRAFQQMIDRCKTPYYMQVDADMLLEPWAVRGLYEGIKEREKTHKCAQYVAWLWDLDVERPITGVKIYRHAICRQYPYEESLSCEQVQNLAMRADGYDIEIMQIGDQHVVKEVNGAAISTWQRTWRTFGTHYPSQTPAMAYERWQRLMQKHRKLPWMGWLGPYPKRLEAKWLANPTDEIARARFLGAMAGLSGPIPTEERDWRKQNQDYRRMAAYVGEYSQGPKELTLYLTDKCNFRCVFGETPCKREAEGSVPKEGDLTADMLRDVLKKHPSIRSCCIAGFGEPLLHPELPELIRILAEHKVFVGIITNGSLLAKKAEELNQLPIGYISVSLNATTAEEHQQMSRTKLWDKVLDGLRVMARSKIRTGVSYVVTNHNTKRIPDLLALCKGLGVKFIHLHNVLPHDGVDNANFLSDVLTVRSTEALADIEHAKTCPGAELVEVWPEVIDLEAGPPGKCMSPFVSIGVDGKGHISGCRRVDPPEVLPFRKYWSEAIWRMPPYTDLISAITGDQDNHPACKGCFGNWKG